MRTKEGGTQHRICSAVAACMCNAEQFNTSSGGFVCASTIAYGGCHHQLTAYHRSPATRLSAYVDGMPLIIPSSTHPTVIVRWAHRRNTAALGALLRFEATGLRILEIEAVCLFVLTGPVPPRYLN